MEFIQDFWGGFKQTTSLAPLYLALVTAGLWADRQFGKSEEVRLAGGLILGLIGGVVLTYLKIAVNFPPWLFPLPLVLLGLICALKSPAENSGVAFFVLLGIGVYFGFGQSWQGGQLATLIGIAGGAVMALAAGIGLGTIVSAAIGSFSIRFFGFGVAAIGVLMLLDRGMLR
ncbi:MAG: hypothetical protein GC191_11965 [Azospirillum sp.]|nr:hypothetical protein [Azospirillum sp.]